MSTPERSTPTTSPAATTLPSSSTTTRRQRVLACVLCQQRKVKCDRKFPCISCIRSCVPCVPATALAAPQRRRKLQERELLDRLSRYESLLGQNNITFEPLHKDISAAEKRSRNAGEGGLHEDLGDELLASAVGPDRSSSPSTPGKSETVYKAKYALAPTSLRFKKTYTFSGIFGTP